MARRRSGWVERGRSWESSRHEQAGEIETDSGEILAR